MPERKSLVSVKKYSDLAIQRNPYFKIDSFNYSRRDKFMVSVEEASKILKSMKSLLANDGWSIEESRSNQILAKTAGGNQLSFGISTYNIGTSIFEASIGVCEHDEACKSFYFQCMLHIEHMTQTSLSSVLCEWSYKKASRFAPLSTDSQKTIHWSSFILRGDSKLSGWCYLWDPRLGDWVFCHYYLSMYGNLVIVNGKYCAFNEDTQFLALSNEDGLICISNMATHRILYIRLDPIEETCLLVSRLYALSAIQSHSIKECESTMKLQRSFELGEERARLRGKNSQTLQDFLVDFKSRFWFTYRRDMQRITPSSSTLMTTDAGWGCMLRCGQMMMAETYARILVGRGWNLFHLECGGIRPDSYISIIKLFEDAHVATAPFGIHSLVSFACQLGHPVGQWFSPTLLVQCLQSQAGKTNPMHFIVDQVQNGAIFLSRIKHFLHSKPVLLMMPLRLGVQAFNVSAYISLVCGALELPQSVGIIGGVSGKCFHIVGHQERTELFYLDPHFVRGPAPPITDAVVIDEYHTGKILSMLPSDLDPSLIFGFLVTNANDFDSLLAELSRLNQSNVFSFIT